MLSGVSVNASTRVSECVVTMSWHRSEASRSKSGEAGENVRVQTEFWFLQTNKWRQVGVAQDGEQAKVAESSVGQPRGRNQKVALFKEYLDTASLDLHIVVVYAVVELPKRSEQRPLRLWISLEAVQNHAEVLAVLRK